MYPPDADGHPALQADRPYPRAGTGGVGGLSHHDMRFRGNRKGIGHGTTKRMSWVGRRSESRSARHPLLLGLVRGSKRLRLMDSSWLPRRYFPISRRLFSTCSCHHLSSPRCFQNSRLESPPRVDIQPSSVTRLGNVLQTLHGWHIVNAVLHFLHLATDLAVSPKPLQQFLYASCSCYMDVLHAGYKQCSWQFDKVESYSSTV